MSWVFVVGFVVVVFVIAAVTKTDFFSAGVGLLGTVLVYSIVIVMVTDPLARLLGINQVNEDRLFGVAFFGVPLLFVTILAVRAWHSERKP